MILTGSGIAICFAGLMLLVYLVEGDPERSVCGNVSPLDLAKVTPADHSAPWIEAITARGMVQNIPDTGKEWGRFAYYDPSTGVTKTFFHDGVAYDWSAGNARLMCDDMRPTEYPGGEGRYCRFFHENPDRYGYIIFNKGYTAETGKYHIGAEARLVQEDSRHLWLTTPLEVLDSPNGFDVEGSECALANMIWILNDSDKTWKNWMITDRGSVAQISR